MRPHYSHCTHFRRACAALPPVGLDSAHPVACPAHPPSSESQAAQQAQEQRAARASGAENHRSGSAAAPAPAPSPAATAPQTPAVGPTRPSCASPSRWLLPTWSTTQDSSGPWRPFALPHPSARHTYPALSPLQRPVCRTDRDAGVFDDMAQLLARLEHLAAQIDPNQWASARVHGAASHGRRQCSGRPSRPCPRRRVPAALCPRDSHPERHIHPCLRPRALPRARGT